jgi:type IX secretion system PorP/SprF family membrane protein
MKYRVVIYSFFLSSGFCHDSKAQLILNTAWDNAFSMSPATAGSLPYAVFSGHYKKAGFAANNCPEVTQLFIDGPVAKGKLGIGASFSDEKAGFSSHVVSMGTISYHLKVSSRAKLSLGISGGMSRRTLDFSAIKVESPEELTGTMNLQTSYSPEAAAGMSYERGKTQLSFATNHLFNTADAYITQSGKQALTIAPLPLYLLAYRQNIFAPTRKCQISLSMILRSYTGSKISPDASVRWSYKSLLFLSGGLRPGSAWYISAGIAVNRAIRFTYAFESNAMNRSLRAPGHEVCIHISILRGHVPTTTNADASGQLKEKLDIESERIKHLQKNIDSLKANVSKLESELSELKSKQISREVVEANLSQPGNTNKQSYRILTENGRKGPDTADKGEYEIVYGVYQLPEYAKKYQKLLKRSLNIDTRLLAPSGQKSRYVYVVSASNYSEKTQALSALEKENQKLEKLSFKIVNGTLWILYKTSDE